ncbi:MAG: hypothetical protein OK439_05775 [Thaumarchaeota archaeon]|nr:hypothetical protein [Nitrososphaerota archaeon]
MAPYNVADLLASVGALQLLPENASRVTRLEALTHAIASIEPGPIPNISTGKLRAICAHQALENLKHYEDPAENQFTEEFTFFGGSYLVIPGIAQSDEYILSNLCKALFLDPHQTLPREVSSRAFQVVSSALRVSNAVAAQANLHRGMSPTSNRYEPIYVPDAAKLEKLKASVSFTRQELELFLTSSKLSPNAIDVLTCRAGTINLEDYTVDNGPILWKPVVECDGKIVLAIPGMLVSAVRQELLRLAAESGVRAQLAELFLKAVWQDVVQSLSYTRNEPVPGPPLPPFRVQNASEGFFSLDRDKLMYCLLVTDPLTRPFDTDPFGVWSTDALGESINTRISEVERCVFSAAPAPTDILHVIAFQGLGGGAAFGLKDTPCNSHSIPLSAEALKTISLLEGGDPLALFNFARARDKIGEHVEITTTNILDEFYLYRKNEYSFYFSDEARPDLIVIPPGDALNLQMEISHERDFHATKTIDDSTVEVTSLHSSSSIPIYSPVADLGERVRLVVEGLPVLVWITGPDKAPNAKQHHHYALFASAVSFWIWQFTPFLSGPLSFLQSKQPIEISLSLPPEEVWDNRPEPESNPNLSPAEAIAKAAENRVEVSLNPEIIPLLKTADNIGERELMRSILTALSALIQEPQRATLSSEEVEKAISVVAPIGLKKMLLLFDSARTPEIDARGLPRFRPLQKVWVNELLDRVGDFLMNKCKLSVGEIAPSQRTSILNQVAEYCFVQMERLASSLCPRGVLHFAVAQSESVHREQAFIRLTIPTRLQCFQSDPEMIEQLGRKIPELANVGLASRFLVEYFGAQPPMGLRPISLDVYDELRAWAYHCINYAMLSDAIHTGIQEHKLSVLPSQRLGIDGSDWRSAMSGHLRAFALDQIGAAPENFKRQWEPINQNMQNEEFKRQLNAATREEFGTPISELLELMEFAIYFAQKHSPGTTRLRIEIFIEEANRTIRRSKENIQAALDILTIGPRGSFWTPPAGYSKQDLYPWRYNRPMSYMRRPFLLSIGQDGTDVTWGMRHVKTAQRFLTDQCTSGKLQAKTQAMRSFMNQRRDEQGEKFNREVFTFFENFQQLAVKNQVKKIGSLRELQDHLGDIDVLIGDKQHNRVLVTECKDLSAARTPYEMANEFNELFVGRAGKKSIVEKHQARNLWVKENLKAVLAFLKLDLKAEWKVIPLIVVDQPLPATYIRESPIQVLSFEEIKRFWPELRRV